MRLFGVSASAYPDERPRVMCSYKPAVSLHFSLPACICTTRCSDQYSWGLVGKGVKLSAPLFPRSCLKKMCCSVSLAVDAWSHLLQLCGLCKHSSLITIRKLSLNSLAPWLVWRAKICIQNKSFGNIRVILLRMAVQREQCLSEKRVLSV